MTIRFLYGRRESLNGKSQAYKKQIRKYLESLGFSQITDSAIQGSFEDMIFVNPYSDPGKKFLVESKAEKLSITSKKFAQELVNYFRISRCEVLQGQVKFILFAQGVQNPTEWELFFGEQSASETIIDWCNWYNNKGLKEDEQALSANDIKQFQSFIAHSEMIVGSTVDIIQATIENQSMSSLSINRKAKKLLELVERRRMPVCSKSRLVLNILSIKAPAYYFLVNSNVNDKTTIYNDPENKPPFLFTKNKEIITCSNMEDAQNPLSKYAQGSVQKIKMSDLQGKNPVFASQLINIHLRRIFWNRGIYRDPKAETYYIPMLDTSNERLNVLDHRKKERWVVKKIIQTKDSKFKKKGDVNFFFHRGVELKTQTYWGESFVELIPRRYYTEDGKNYSDGEMRAKIDRKFRNSIYDRSPSRLSLMKFWKHLLFQSPFKIPPENWFEEFQFGEFEAKTVNWAPKVIERNQASLWDYKGEDVNV